MTSLSIAICTHHSRKEMAWRLQDKLACPISYDDGSLGSALNHDETLRIAGVGSSDWVIAMEDDAQPVDDFYVEAARALSVAPEPIVALYYGYIGDDRELGRMLAEDDCHWLVSTALSNTVCTCIRRDFYPAFMEAVSIGTATASDMKYEQAAKSIGQHRFAYSYPSLVEHADEQTVHYTGADHVERHAYRVGTRGIWDGSRVRDMA